MSDDRDIEGKEPVPEGCKPADGQSVVGAVWQEGTPGHGVLKLSDVRTSRPGSEGITVGDPGANNHSAFVSDHRGPDGRLSGINVTWIEAPVGDTSGSGRVMKQRFDAATLANAANDNPSWAAGEQILGAVGRDPTIAGLDGGDTFVAWIGPDGQAQGRIYAADDADGRSPAEYHFGPAAGPGPDNSRRLQVAEQSPGTFAVMWLALADSGLSLRGSLFVGPPDAGPSDDRSPWAEQPIADVKLPAQSTGAFSLAAIGDGGDLQLTYSVVDLAAGAVRILSRNIDTNASQGIATAEIPVDHGAAYEHAAAHAHGAQPVVRSVREGTSNSDVATSDAAAAASTLPIGADQPVAGIAPISAATQDGFAVAWTAPGLAQGTVEIKLSLYDIDGSPRVLPDGGTVIRVTETAAAAVAPAVSGWGSGAVVAYVDAGDGGLSVRAYDDSGSAIGNEGPSDSAGGGQILEVAVGTQSVAQPDGTAEEQITVAYVQETEDSSGGEAPSGYGSIFVQRYGVEDQADGSPALVGLGIDGDRDSADAPVQLIEETDGDSATTEGVYGRAPVVDGLDDGQVAIAWVECLDTGETIKGRVLAPDGSQVMVIDLTSLIGADGIAKSSRPTLLDTADGDIIVSWMQADGDEGYVVMAARYDSDGAGGWLAPDAPIRLQDFDELPKDYSVTLSEGEDTLISVTWRGDSSGSGSGDIHSQKFDIDGNDIGSAKKVGYSEALQVDQSSTEAFTTAGLADGKIVIVYPDDGDLAAHVIDAPGVVAASEPDASEPFDILADTFDFVPAYADGSILVESVQAAVISNAVYEQLVQAEALVQADDGALVFVPADQADSQDALKYGGGLPADAHDVIRFS